MTGRGGLLGSWATIAAVLLLTACSREDAEPAARASAPSETPPAASAAAPRTAPPLPPPADNPTVGGDGSAIQLSALSAAEVEAAALPGELGCAFATDTASPLLVVKGDVASRDPSLGIVKVGDYVERVAAPGGFDAALKGPTYTGAGKTVRITLTAPAVHGGESPPVPATLTYERADGASRTFVGRWECGP